jgi:hypothetical protein
MGMNRPRNLRYWGQEYRISVHQIFRLGVYLFPERGYDTQRISGKGMSVRISAASIKSYLKGKRPQGPELQTAPRPGSKLRDLYDFLNDNEGAFITLINKGKFGKSSDLAARIETLREYDLDIRIINGMNRGFPGKKTKYGSPRVYVLAGNNKGPKYDDIIYRVWGKSLRELEPVLLTQANEPKHQSSNPVENPQRRKGNGRLGRDLSRHST